MQVTVLEVGYEGVARIQAAQQKVVITIPDLQKGRGFPHYFFSSRRDVFHGVRQNPQCYHKIIYSMFIGKYRPIFQSLDFDRGYFQFNEHKTGL